MADVPPMHAASTVDEFVALLRPGDVIVYDTRSPIGGLIQWVDRAPVNHASIMRTQRDTLEAYLPENPDDPHVQLTDIVEMLGFDFHSATALRHVAVAEDPDLASGIIRNIDRYLGRHDRFTTLDLILLGPAALRRSGYADDPHLPRLPMQVVMWALNSFYRAALRKVPQGPAQLFCSELVYRCLVEDGTGLSVTVTDPIADEHHVDPAEDEVGPWGEATLAEEAACWKELRSRMSEPVSDIEAVGDGPRPDFVTPGDLWRSPDLRPVAHYQWPPRKKAPSAPLTSGESSLTSR